MSIAAEPSSALNAKYLNLGASGAQPFVQDVLISECDDPDQVTGVKEVAPPNQVNDDNHLIAAVFQNCMFGSGLDYCVKRNQNYGLDLFLGCQFLQPSKAAYFRSTPSDHSMVAIIGCYFAQSTLNPFGQAADCLNLTQSQHDTIYNSCFYAGTCNIQQGSQPLFQFGPNNQRFAMAGNANLLNPNPIDPKFGGSGQEILWSTVANNTNPMTLLRLNLHPGIAPLQNPPVDEKFGLQNGVWNVPGVGWNTPFHGVPCGGDAFFGLPAGTSLGNGFAPGSGF
jgi:hypothetical protein